MVPRHLYVHVPFCARRCAYCDFAIAVRRRTPVAEFLETLGREIALRFPGGPEGEVETIYLGGGTPSRLGSAGVGGLLALVRRRWPAAEGAEVTLEANPEDVTVEVARAWRETGITRVSLGVQSFDDRVLRWMHRTHDAAAAEAAFGALLDAGFQDVSLDLIFALPPEVERSWAEDLARAISLGPMHVSCYGLTVEPQTPLVRWRDRGLVRDADEERYESEFVEADRRLTASGFEHYEVSNYARPGFRARHNSAYWRRVPYVGLGPSAHGFDGRLRRWNLREYVAWRDAIRSGSDPMGGTDEPDAAGVALETAYLGLRTDDGVALTDANRPDVMGWVAEGWAEMRDGKLRLTPSGWLRLDRLVSGLTDVRSR